MWKQGYISLCLLLVICSNALCFETRQSCSGIDYTQCYDVPKFDESLSMWHCSCELYGLSMNVCGDFLHLDANTTENSSDDYLFSDYIIDNSTVNANDSFEGRYIRFLARYSECVNVGKRQYYTTFTIIGKCPEHWKDEVVRTQCENQSQELPPIELNAQYRFVFRNIFCAVCHGLSEDFVRSNVIIWEASMSCSNNDKLPLADSKPRIDDSHCSTVYSRPKQKQTSEANGEDIINYDCISCAEDLRQDTSTTSLNCIVCQLGIFLFEFSPLPTLPFESLSVLFEIPTQKESNIFINGDIFTSSQLCKDDENLDLLYQRCRKFVCPAGQFPLEGRCQEESKVFVSPEFQPFPNNSRTFDINITFEDRLANLFDVITLMTSKVDMEFIQDFEEEFASLKIESNIPISKLLNNWSKQPIRFLSGVVLTLQMNNINRTDNETCLNDDFRCIQHTPVYFLNSKPFSRVDIGSKSFMYPLDNIMYDLTIDKGNSSLVFNEVCVCFQEVEENNSSASINCSGPMYEYNEHEYILIGNHSLELVEQKLRIDESQYYFKGNVAVICHDEMELKDFQFFKYDEIQGYISIVCTAISVFFLLVSLVIFAMFTELRTLPGKMTASLSGLLIIAQCLLYLPQMHVGVCKYVAAFTHFCWLSVFTWMNCIGGNMVITFHPTLMLAHRALKENNAFWRYCVIALLGPLILCVVLLVLDVIEGDHYHIRYGEINCVWMGDHYGFIFGFFVLVALTIVFNIICFCVTLYEIEKSMKTSDDITGRKRDRSRCHMYIRLSSVMGFSWIFGFVAVFGDIPVLWYVFIVLNGLQGVFIFISFTVNARTRGLLRTWISEKTFSSVVRSPDTA
ncbi:hypothetical protein LOTGIDRAFT_165558 [Lottia gigantea]|uniref:G-protein coupled receptors family 2 profile 2 domain-containing protein n=1 Tax=Lottia gigantea TaxID=225164 RepID=V4BIK3_LOTGI|nr:hypothetical protein LOTGIDRAFT_165558 [Lottia gigantea]ESO88434.1 hypothetical protein LOTGIDRAFT_165558 [Lottia gigantea]